MHFHIKLWSDKTATITSQLIIKFNGPFCKSAAYLLDLEPETVHAIQVASSVFIIVHVLWCFNWCDLEINWIELNWIVNQVNIFFNAGTSWSVRQLSVSLLTAPVALNFISSLLMLILSIICLKIHSLSPSLYIPLTDINFWSKSYLCRWTRCLQTLR